MDEVHLIIIYFMVIIMWIVIITVVANCERKCTSKYIVMLSLEIELVKTEEDTKSRYVLRCHNITVIKIKIFTSKILAEKNPTKYSPEPNEYQRLLIPCTRAQPTISQ